MGYRQIRLSKGFSAPMRKAPAAGRSFSDSELSIANRLKLMRQTEEVYFYEISRCAGLTCD